MEQLTGRSKLDPSIAFPLEPLFWESDWLASASDRLRGRLLAAARPSYFRRGERIWAQGDEAGGIHGVVWGGIGVEASIQGHLVRMGHIMRRGAWFGEDLVLSGSDRGLGFIAVENSMTVNLPLPFLVSLMQQDEELQSALALLAVMNTRIAIWTTCDLLIPSASRRIAAVLLRVTGVRDNIKPVHPNGFPLNQVMVGELANASRAHVNRVLGELTRRRLIAKRYHHLQVIDPVGLSNFAYDED